MQEEHMHLQIADTSATLTGDLFFEIDCLRSAGQFIVHVFSRARSGICTRTPVNLARSRYRTFGRGRIHYETAKYTHMRSICMLTCHVVISLTE